MPEWLYEYRNVFSKHKSERIPLQELYDHVIDFMEGTKLPKLAKVYCKEAKLQAGIKPTAFCSAIDKENSIESSLDFLYYLYNYYIVCALFSYAYHVTHHVTSCDVML